MIDFLVRLVITVLFIASSMMIIKWRGLTKDKPEVKLYSRMSFGLFVLGVYSLLTSFESLTLIPALVNPLNKVVELIGLLIIVFGFLDFLEVRGKA